MDKCCHITAELNTEHVSANSTTTGLYFSHDTTRIIVQACAPYISGDVSPDPPDPPPIDPLTIPLTFTAEKENSMVSLGKTGSPTVSGLHYRIGTDGEWLPYTCGTKITLPNIGDAVQFWNAENTLSSSNLAFVRFSMTGTIAGSGNVMSLLNFRDDCVDFCFYMLFYGCKSLTLPPDFPSMVIAENCYMNAFGGTSITVAPDLPATNAAIGCYRYMFRYCPIVKAPTLGVTQLEHTALSYLFEGTDIREIEVNFSEWHNTATNNWVKGVPANGTFIKPKALPEEYGVNRIPEGWTVINK